MKAPDNAAAVYFRTAGQRASDFQQSVEFEQRLFDALRATEIHHASRTHLDLTLCDGTQLDAKQKKQTLSKRWHLLPGVPEQDLFVVTASEMYKAFRLGSKDVPTYIALQDDLTDRMFVAKTEEILIGRKQRVLRASTEKWIIDLTQFAYAPTAELLRSLTSSKKPVPITELLDQLTHPAPLKEI